MLWAGGAAALFLAGLLVPAVMPLWLVLGPEQSVSLLLDPVRSAVYLFIACLPCWMTRREAGTAVWWPITLLPLTLAGLLSQPWLPRAFGENLLYFGPLALLAWSAARWAAVGVADDRVVSRRSVWLAAVVAAAIYTVLGVFFTTSVGEHSGDEAHYIVQAASLWHDGDLDLRNQLADVPLDQRWNLHISPRARDGHWYSWHSFGLSLLIAPTVPLGLWARHLVLGLFAGLGCAAMLQLCRAYRAAAVWSWLSTILFSASTYWSVYAARCLPEVAGATLLAWSAVAVTQHQRRPWRSLALLVACTGFLPWLHTRFIPLSALVVGWYGISVLLSAGSVRRKALRLTVLAALQLASGAIFVAVHHAMFHGVLPLSASEILMSYPWGIWLATASDRGLLYSLPMGALMLAATVEVALRDRPLRSEVGLALAALAATAIFSCATIYFTGGCCLSGRYLLVALPLFVPVLARALGRTRSETVGAAVFLGLISIAALVLMLARLPEFGKSFSDPLFSLRVVYPQRMATLARLFLSPEESLIQPSALALLCGGMLLFLLPVHLRGARRVVLLAVAVVVAAVAVSHPAPSPSREDPRRNARLLERHGSLLSRALICPDGVIFTQSLFKVSDRLVSSRALTPWITTEDLGTRMVGRWISQPRLKSNDGDQGGPRWTTMAPPFRAKAGACVARLAGRLDGDARVVWSIREGSRLLAETVLVPGADGRINGALKVVCKGAGDIYLLARIEGTPGAFSEVRVSWSPYSEQLLEVGRLTLD